MDNTAAFGTGKAPSEVNDPDGQSQRYKVSEECYRIGCVLGIERKDKGSERLEAHENQRQAGAASFLRHVTDAEQYRVADRNQDNQYKRDERIANAVARCLIVAADKNGYATRNEAEQDTRDELDHRCHPCLVA